MAAKVQAHRESHLTGSPAPTVNGSHFSSFHCGWVWVIKHSPFSPLSICHIRLATSIIHCPCLLLTPHVSAVPLFPPHFSVSSFYSLSVLLLVPIVVFSIVLMCMRNPIIHPFVVSLFSTVTTPLSPALRLLWVCSTPIPLTPHSDLCLEACGNWLFYSPIHHSATLDHLQLFCSSPCLQGLKSEQICHWFSRQPGSPQEVNLQMTGNRKDVNDVPHMSQHDVNSTDHR